MGVIVANVDENLPAGTVLMATMNATDLDVGDRAKFFLVRIVSFPDDGTTFSTVVCLFVCLYYFTALQSTHTTNTPVLCY